MLHYAVCHQPPEPPLVDGTDPLWPFCHQWPAINTPYGYAPGRAEVTWEYDDAGGVERVVGECGGTRYTITAERDDRGRVIRWVGPWSVSLAREITYDENGMLATSTHNPWTIVDDGYERVRSFQYREDGQLEIERRATFSNGVPAGSDIGAMLEYESGELVRVIRGDDPDCALITEYVREEGRIVRAFTSDRCEEFPPSVPVEMEVTYEWSGDELRRSQTWFQSAAGWHEVARYINQQGRMVEVQRYRNGRLPHATYQLDYDEQGRLTHLQWWGHGPEDRGRWTWNGNVPVWQ